MNAPIWHGGLSGGSGLGIRESTGLVTDDGAAFVPHLVAVG